MRYFLLFLSIAILGVGCQPQLGGADPLAGIKREEADNISLKGNYKHIDPFVASDGKTYQVDTETQWFTDGTNSKTYKIREVIPVQHVTSTI